jgi:hypothetical protein
MVRSYQGAQVVRGMSDEPVSHGIAAIDIERFSRSEWTDRTRVRLRGRLHRLVDRALTQAKVPAARTDRQDTGDGLLLFIAAAAPIAGLLHPFVSTLAPYVQPSVEAVARELGSGTATAAGAADHRVLSRGLVEEHPNQSQR